MEIREEIIDVSTDDGEMAVVVKQPAESGDHPTIVMFLDAPGIRKASHEFMAKLASAGYRVITPDLHHRQGRLVHFEPEQIAADPSLRETMYGWIAAMTDEQIQHDVDCALGATGVEAAAKLGAIGFCLGARGVVRSMLRLPDQFVCGAGWHPSFLVDDGTDSPHRLVDDIVGELYLGIGDADQVQSIAMHQQFLDAAESNDGIDVVIWPGADHGFTWPGYATYDEAASNGSWDRTIAMFERCLT